MPVECRAALSARVEHIEKLEQHKGGERQGLRGLLIASRTVDADSASAPDAFNMSVDLSAWVADLTFVGLVGLVDPPRAEVKAAIAQCRQAGITVKMITGDHPLTAAAIAAQLGLVGRAMTGAELERIGPAELPDAIKNVAVFARVTPVTKVNIVRALQKSGHVVAMTGDGVNDAPALKAPTSVSPWAAARRSRKLPQPWF